MAYSNNKPQATDRISASQGVLLDDFIAIDTGWLVNHVNLNLPNTGKHHYVTLPNNTFGAGFPYTTLANEVALYSESGNLYFRPEGQAVGVHTLDQKLNMDAPTGATNSVTFPNGLIIKWGLSTLIENLGSGKTRIDFPVAFPNACFNVQVTTNSTGYGTNTFVNVYDLLVASFKCTSSTRSGSSSGGTIYWLAIGY
jgi:hypothetical protein